MSSNFFSKNFKVLEKPKTGSPNINHSIILEHRNKPETLLFESQAVCVLCEYLVWKLKISKESLY